MLLDNKKTSAGWSTVSPKTCTSQKHGSPKLKDYLAWCADNSAQAKNLASAPPYPAKPSPWHTGLSRPILDPPSRNAASEPLCLDQQWRTLNPHAMVRPTGEHAKPTYTPTQIIPLCPNMVRSYRRMQTQSWQVII